MSIIQLKTEVAEISEQMKAAETRKEALAAELGPMIHSYFTSRVSREKNPDKRRDYAYFNASKQFDILNETTLRFRSRNRSGVIICDVLISDILDEYASSKP
jgi:hypothetical protein